MIIDTSALVAILDQEPEADRIVRAIAAVPDRMLSAANLVESYAGFWVTRLIRRRGEPAFQ